jgi:hypothetical protein
MHYEWKHLVFSGKEENDNKIKKTIASETLDALAIRTGKIPDIIKIDVEGFEWQVLQGAKQVMQTHKPVIFLEIHKELMHGLGKTVTDIVSILKVYNYTLYNMDGVVYNNPEIEIVDRITRIYAK